jgi:hypothetical protein
MLNLDYDAIHRFVDGHPDARWDGWDMLLFKETPAGATHMKGAFVGGRWGIQDRISPDSNGKWVFKV